MRLQLQRGRNLTFGYVPSANSAKLLAVGLPLLLGRAPGDSEFQRLVSNGAAKVFGSLGWSSSAYSTGIEDKYLITLQPSIVARLRPSFGVNNIDLQLQHLLPDDAYSVTCYRFATPAAAWTSLKSAVSSQVDALSAVVFSSLLKSALLSYGVDDAESFLSAVNGEMVTLRMDETAERAILIAGVHDRASLRQILARQMSVNLRNSSPRTEIFEGPTGEVAASLGSEFIVMGSAADVRLYVENKERGVALMTADRLRRVTFFVSTPTASNVVTYTNDGDRIHNFFSTIIAANERPAESSEGLEAAIATLPYSSTETTLNERGIERTTRSPLGQFSTLLPLLFPQRHGPVKDSNQPR